MDCHVIVGWFPITMSDLIISTEIGQIHHPHIEKNICIDEIRFIRNSLSLLKYTKEKLTIVLAFQSFITEKVFDNLAYV